MTLWRNSLVLVTALAFLCACDDGAQHAAVVVASDNLQTVRGRATKGPLEGARIELLAVDASGQPVGPPVATTQTDAAGNWAVDVPADHDGLLVRAAGGRFVDESDPNLDAPRTIQLGDEDTLLSFLPAGERAASVTLLTNALVRKSRLEADAANFASRLEGNRGLYTQTLGLDPLATAAADPLSPAGSDDERRYALIAGALAYALNAVAIEQGRAVADFATIELLLADLVDCTLDGNGLGGQRVYDISALEGRTLADEILRFRNNHFDDYTGLELPVIRQEGCPAAPDAADAIPPVFTSQAAPLILPAQDASGAVPVGTLIEQAIAAFSATDNRDDAPRIEVRLPERLPLGRSLVPVLATDGWGNVATTDWQIDVLDLEPPSLVAPPAVRVAAAGVRTPVDLGAPLVSDNLSAGTSLVVSIDAPQAGFVVGDTLVTWQARDEAGLAATATQQVTVVGAQPQTIATIPPLVGAVGSAIEIDLSAYFTDPFEAALGFALAGLPAGSGLSLDPASGLVTGIVSAADLAASPLQLLATASNGQFEASVTISLSLAPQLPVFALSVGELELDEDFTGQVRVTSQSAVAAPVGTTDFAAVLSAPVVDFVIDQGGTVTLSAKPDAFGEATLDVTAINLVNGETFTRRMDILVRPVNDPPIALLASEAVTANAGEPLDLALAGRFEDVDDTSLNLSVAMQPRSLVLGPDGVLRGSPRENEANVELYPIAITATDAEGASASTLVLLTIAVPDLDGDGLSDAVEASLGTDPGAVDSDGDGVDDATEVAAGSGPTLVASAVLYVSPSGDNANDGSSFASALRDLEGLRGLPGGLSEAQPTIVIFAADQVERYPGSLWLMPPCDHIVFAGSVSAFDGRLALAPDGAPRTTLTAVESPSLEIDNCSDVRIVNLNVEDNTRHAFHVENSSISISNVRLRNNRSAEDGGAVFVADSDVELRDVVFSANDAQRHGGALAAVGSTGVLSLQNVAVHGNTAVGDGGGLYIDGASVDLAVSNALVTGNAAGRGAGIYASSAGSVVINNATLNNNRSRQPGDGAAVDVTTGIPASVRDSLIVGNTDGPGRPSGLGEPIDSDYNSMDRDPVGANDLVVTSGASPFADRYLLTAAANAIDLGSTTAEAAGLDGAFSVSGSVYADEGTLDRGFHDRFGPRAIDLRADTLGGTLTLAPTARSRWARYLALDIRPLVESLALGPGHRVRLAPVAGRAVVTNAVRGADAGIPATDMGDGRYRVYLDARAGEAIRFALTVDGVTSESEMELDCALGGCQPVPRGLLRP